MRSLKSTRLPVTRTLSTTLWARLAHKRPLILVCFRPFLPQPQRVQIADVACTGFKIEKSHKFEPGEVRSLHFACYSSGANSLCQVFKVLWYEPHGGTPAPGGASLSEKAKLYDHYGQPIYVGFRRFIVIANDEGHCQCVPILTYGKKGCKKRGVKPRTHGIAYAYGSKARPIPGEPDLGFKPIPIKLEVKNEEIKPESRVNYSKLVTVEHNVKVFFIGYVPRESFKIVSNAVTKCWNEKLLTPRDNRERP